MIKYFKKIFVQNSELSRFQDAVADLFNQMLSNPIQDYIILKDVVLTTTQAKINHLLGREPLGWFLIKKNANINVWEVSRTNQYIELDASGTVTVDIYVF